MQQALFSRGAAWLVMLALMFFAAGAGAGAAAQTVPNKGVEGWWVTADGKAAIVIAPCAGQLCGRVEWLREPMDSAGKPKTDIHNPDASLQVRPLCNLTMLGNFTQNPDGSWGGGWIYDPSTGSTYKSNMHVAQDGTLHVRGFIGISLFGRSEIMSRPATPLQPCAPN